MSWVYYLTFLMIITIIDHGYCQEKSNNRQVESASDNEKTDLIVDILNQLAAFENDINNLKQRILSMKEQLSAVNQNLENKKKEILSNVTQQTETISQESEHPEDTFLVPRSTDQMLLLVGGKREKNGRIEGINETTALYNGTWIRKSPLPVQVSGMAVSQLPTKNMVVAFGGTKDYYSLKTNFLYYVDEDRWKSDSSMNREYPDDFCSVTFENKVYVMGGAYGIQTKSDVRVCDSSSGYVDNVCEGYPRMLIPRRGAKAVIYHGYIYVTGGENLRSCEKSNLQQPAIYRWDNVPAWTSVPDMIYPRYRHGLVTFNDKIYAIGGVYGFNGSTYNVLKSVESFDGYEWVEEPSLNEARYHAAVGVIGQYIYVVGGSGSYNIWERKYNPVMSVEIFDLGTSKWRFVDITGTSPLPLVDSGAVVVDLN